MKIDIMSFTAIPKVKRILSFQLFGRVKSHIQIIHNTVQNKTILPKHSHTPPTVLYLLGLFNLTFWVYQVYSSLHTTYHREHAYNHMYVAVYHDSHALVHISTCTHTFQPALIHAFHMYVPHRWHNTHNTVHACISYMPCYAYHQCSTSALNLSSHVHSIPHSMLLSLLSQCTHMYPIMVYSPKYCHIIGTDYPSSTPEDMGFWPSLTGP